MGDVTRRSVVLTAAAAGTAFGLGRPLEIAAPALAQGGTASSMNPKNFAFHRFTVGDIEVTQVLDGAIERPHAPGFIKNASVEDTRRALEAAGLPGEGLRVEIDCIAYVP